MSPRPYVPDIRAMPGAVYSPFAARLVDHPGPLYPLHVGDTWLAPPEGARSEDLREDDLPGLHRYCDTAGIVPLRDALVQKLRARNGLDVERDNVWVAAGATGALAALVSAIAGPGDEVLILAPFWPLIRGIVQSFRATPVEVPFYDRVDGVEAAVEAVREKISERSVALYVSTPSNPTGKVLPESWLIGLAELAREHDLWLLSDEVYEDFVYLGQHVSLGRFAPERTASVFSFSKAYGMAGVRVGYVAAPAAWTFEAQKVGTHNFYHAPQPGQWAALRALERGAQWQEAARTLYQQAGERTAAALGLSPPAGSTFFFLDVSSKLDDRGMPGFLEDCFEDGVLIAPGASSGAAYQGWVRLCYTAAPPDEVARAALLLARRLS